MKKRSNKFKGFRRKHWLVGDMTIREQHDGSFALTRTWREGEPMMRVKGYLNGVRP